MIILILNTPKPRAPFPSSPLTPSLPHPLFLSVSPSQTGVAP